MSTTTVSASAMTRHSVALPFDWRTPAVARRVAGRWLAGSCGRPDRTADAVLIVSELVTNVVRHTRGSCVLTLTIRGTLLDIAVGDESEELPQTSWDPPVDERGGLGFPLIRGLGGRIKVVPALGGKTLHVALDLDPALDPDAALGRDPAPDLARVLRRDPVPVPGRDPVPDLLLELDLAFDPALALDLGGGGPDESG
ncbi:ATP-binding protein [Streptomyces sp. NPDC002057]|uniref:ATP-binding protein n=1 Tax=Streptomyces sp. NPDC002057 TaxID=3154664 RepID=UPI0033165667